MNVPVSLCTLPSPHLLSHNFETGFSAPVLTDLRDMHMKPRLAVRATRLEQPPRREGIRCSRTLPFQMLTTSMKHARSRRVKTTSTGAERKGPMECKKKFKRVRWLKATRSSLLHRYNKHRKSARRRKCDDGAGGYVEERAGKVCLLKAHLPLFYTCIPAGRAKSLLPTFLFFCLLIWGKLHMRGSSRETMWRTRVWRESRPRSLGWVGGCECVEG